eukprot:675148-Alexandrium_andersonii.AAC.1
MSHAKMMCIDDLAIIASCNWTTASRTNLEIGVLMDLNAAGRDRLEAMFEEWKGLGVPLREALKGHAQRWGGDCDRSSGCPERTAALS